MINSLRLMDHREQVFLVDCGLTRSQRACLDGHVTLVPAATDAHPALQRHVAPLQYPSDVMVLLDTDVIVTRSLSDLISRAAAGKVVAFSNDHSRYFPEWSKVTNGRAPRRQPYVAAGHLFMAAEIGRHVLRSLQSGQERIDLRLTVLGHGTPADPFYLLEMDVLNAVLAAEFDINDLEVIDQALSPYTPFTGVRVVDERKLICRTADGREPYFLHHVLGKPWLQATRDNVYSQLLSRLLLDTDVAIAVDPRDVPLRLRRGHLGRLARLRASAHVAVRARVRGRLGVRRRLAARRRRLSLKRAPGA